MERRLEINQLIVDDPEVMKLDTSLKVAFLFDLIATAQLSLNEDFPDEQHLVYVRIGE